VDFNITRNEFGIDIINPPRRMRSSDRDGGAEFIIPNLALQLIRC
jgi:hypothetical protein